MPSSLLVGTSAGAASLPSGANRQGFGVAVEAILTPNLCINDLEKRRRGGKPQVEVRLPRSMSRWDGKTHLEKGATTLETKKGCLELFQCGCVSLCSAVLQAQDCGMRHVSTEVGTEYVAMRCDAMRSASSQWSLSWIPGSSPSSPPPLLPPTQVLSIGHRLGPSFVDDEPESALFRHIPTALTRSRGPDLCTPGR